MITTATPFGPSSAKQTTLYTKQLIIELGVTVINLMDFSIFIKGSRLNGLDNFGIFTNNGNLYIDQTGNEGLSIRYIGSFINNGTINIGQEEGMIGNDGLVTSGAFTKHAIINIDNLRGNGLRNNNLAANFINLGDIYIGQKDGNIQSYGWLIQKELLFHFFVKRMLLKLHTKTILPSISSTLNLCRKCLKEHKYRILKKLKKQRTWSVS